MTFNMNDSRTGSIAQLKEFSKVNEAGINFTATDRKEKYQWINEVLTKFDYLKLKSKKDKGGD